MYTILLLVRPFFKKINTHIRISLLWKPIQENGMSFFFADRWLVIGDLTAFPVPMCHIAVDERKVGGCWLPSYVF